MLQVALVPETGSLLTSNALAVEQRVICTPVSFGCSIVIEGSILGNLYKALVTVSVLLACIFLHAVWVKSPHAVLQPDLCFGCGAGKLYDPTTQLIAGLKPAHFLTLATPHMGCDGEGPAQVQFYASLPHVKQRLEQLVQRIQASAQS